MIAAFPIEPTIGLCDCILAIRFAVCYASKLRFLNSDETVEYGVLPIYSECSPLIVICGAFEGFSLTLSLHSSAASHSPGLCKPCNRPQFGYCVLLIYPSFPWKNNFSSFSISEVTHATNTGILTEHFTVSKAIEYQSIS
jgi:hypothetical protein